MTIVVQAPSGCSTERRWAVAVVCRTILGLAVEIVDDAAPAGSSWRITTPGDPRDITVPDLIFPRLAADWLGSGSLDGFADSTDDWFGAAFVLLSRYEESLTARRDNHGRFPADACRLAVDQPWVDRWAVELAGQIQRRWPGFPLPQRHLRLALSCDLDHPLTSLVDASAWIEAAVDVLRRGDPALALRRLACRVIPGVRDPFDTCDALMDAAEAAGVPWTCTILAGGACGPHEGRYRLDLPHLQRLLPRIAARGHRLGLHASYAAGNAAQQVGVELEALRAAAQRLGITGAITGGRHHFLRCDPARHWPAWQSAGAGWEGSCGYAEVPGFRSGTCHPYPAYDVHRRQPLGLVVEPLIAMDTSLFAHLRLNPEAALTRIRRLVDAARPGGGVFTLLWHNTGMAERRHRQMLQNVLRNWR